MRKFIIYLVLMVFGLFLVSCNSLCDECIDINKDYICDECGGSIGRTGPIIDSYFKVEVTGAKDSLVENLKSLYRPPPLCSDSCSFSSTSQTAEISSVFRRSMI